MNREEFFAQFKDYSDNDLKQIAKAYWLAKEVHRGQERNDGERYFEHCRRTACLALSHGEKSSDSVIMALLHDCIEDGYLPHSILEELFGQYVEIGVGILSKVTMTEYGTGKIKKNKKELSDYYAEIAKSVRPVRMIKLCDRLDNLRSMNVWSKERQQKYIVETETYILPIARDTDEKLVHEIEKECNRFNGPYVFEAKCSQCKNKYDIVARTTLWMENKFLKYEHKIDDSIRDSWAQKTVPVPDPFKIRTVLLEDKWENLPVSLGEFYCQKGKHFFCKRCVKFYRTECDEPGWSPVEFIPKCPIHG